jgi:hypothetical protein
MCCSTLMFADLMFSDVDKGVGILHSHLNAAALGQLLGGRSHSA